MLKLKQAILLISPPILIYALRSLMRYLRSQDLRLPISSTTIVGAPESTKVPEWEYIPEGWAVSDSRIKGWDIQSLAEVQRQRWTVFLSTIANGRPLGLPATEVRPSPSACSYHNTLITFGYVAALAALRRGRLAMLDWGGGIGQYRMLARELLPGIEIDYTCKDVSAMCVVGRQIQPDVSFIDKDDIVFNNKYDLIVASSSIHYAENWREVLINLCRACDGYLYITRTPVVYDHPSFVVVQRPYAYGYDTEYLCWFLNRQELLDTCLSAGARLVREFVLSEQPVVHNAPEQCIYAAMLFDVRHDCTGSPKD